MPTIQRRTNDSKVGLVRTILDLHTQNLEDPDGDKWLSQATYALEAIDAVVNDDMASSTLRMFLAELPEATR